ncbi:MAG: T9SS type A sorting domain-containing protein [Flavobacteriales bacterium]|nr:T9SS type A sorting domain-containing protein [Flavobacteriales bacterium]
MFKKALLSLGIITSLSSFSQFAFERILDIPVTDGTVQDMPWAGGLDYCQFSNIDLNFDGVEDLFVFDRTCDKVLTFIQTGGAGEIDFVYAPQYEDDFPDDLQDWALLVDYNCDGLKDIYTYAVGGLRIFKNTGSSGSGNTFELASPFVYTSISGSPSPLYMNSNDIPAFTDIDGDGDIDVLQYGSAATAVEYNKNLSVELTGGCDSIVYETKNECWGNFKEDGAASEIELFATSFPCNGTIGGEEDWTPFTDRGDRHAGSTLLALDLDASGVMDLIIGDAGWPNLLWLYNGGTAPNTDSDMDVMELYIPNTTDSVHLYTMPGAFYVDINNDGIRDLISSPADVVTSHNWESVWWFTNSGADNEPTFNYGGKTFLQGGMIENGTSSLPVFFDANGDGLKDLLVSCRTKFNESTLTKYSTINYYENTGTAEAPEFTFVEEDYEDITTMGLGAGISFYPTFGDLDGDGDEDMVLGEYIGYIYYLENTGGAGNAAIFNTSVILNDIESDPIQRGNHPNPHLIDLDRDGDLDLVIGGTNGFLTYYENVGTEESFSFEHVTDSLGDIDVSEYWNPNGFAVPAFMDIEGEWELIVGSLNGDLHYYDNIEDNLDGTWNLVDSTLEDINIGDYAAPAIYDITEDNHLEMVLGNERGGVGFYKSALMSDIGIQPNPDLAAFKIYPNPAQTQLTVDLGQLPYKELLNMEVKLFDISGRMIYKVKPKTQKVNLDVSNFASGTYLVEVISSNKTQTQKVIVE